MNRRLRRCSRPSCRAPFPEDTPRSIRWCAKCTQLRRDEAERHRRQRDRHWQLHRATPIPGDHPLAKVEQIIIAAHLARRPWQRTQVYLAAQARATAS